MASAQIEQFRQYLRRRNYSPHTMENYALDLRLFFDQVNKPVKEISWRDVDRFIQQQHDQGLAATTINRRLHAIKQFFDFLVQQERLTTNPVKPSHYLRQGRPLPKRLTAEQVKRLFAQITNPMDHALFLLMLRCGLRVSEVAKLKVSDIDWEQQALLIDQGKGRKDRWVYVSPDALRSLKECWSRRPASVPGDYFFWNQKRTTEPLSIKAIQKKMERYASAAGVVASCHSLRHTVASNLLEEGAEVVSIKAFLGHESILSSQRYARLSDQKIKQSYLKTIKKVIQKTRV
ncbi:MAG: tyrosine-type recombinase/integrase [Acidobacteria bacterium]|nr:tyrosine-type recombinase/integrase [Acidobacteriota bacterium]